MTTILLVLIMVLVAVNMAATFWTYRQIVIWLDAIGEMVGEHIDRKETEK